MGELVAVEADVEVGIPLEIAGEVLRADAELPTLVLDVAAIVGEAGSSCRTCRQGDSHKHVGGLLVVVIYGEGQTAAEHSQVETYVGLRGGLPRQLRIAQGRLRTGRHGIGIVTFAKPLETIDAVGSEVRVVAQSALVTGLSPAATNLEVVEPVDILQELLLRDTPGSRERGEVAPAMTGSEFRRTVGTEVGREQIGVLEVVAQTSEVGKDGPVGGRRACACPADLVGAVQRLDVGIGIVGTIDPVVAVFRTRPRGTGHEIKAVDAELTLVVEHIVPNHHGIDGTRVVARTVVVSTIARLDRVEEVHRSALRAVEVELAGEGQALGEQRDDGLACA